MFRKSVPLALLVAVTAGVSASSQAATQFTPLTRINKLTFSQAASLPGVTLAPGTYVFEAGPGNTNPNVVRVMSQNRQTQYFLGMTIPVARDKRSDSGIVTFGETPRGAAAPILAWYPMGSNSGHEFIYR